ncbi:RnfABCDGE type electron transport complex subunit G [Halorhodospira halochloris]|uniref:RnfABCDGE type electron transport complex subunit G n=1 Tax=Halorhodospira halochloris TaxID=1052 RepID=UPI001EE84179|nr:RnfABCDGE type electron transport complex subunit G [Halorhodospira halochloris]MCG5530513.1 RnfABCDGE type electron transport complex subunit G [Halorhodospira halochloris]
MSTPQRPSYQQRTAYHVTLLGTVALVCSTALVISDEQTREQIKAAQQQRLAEQIMAVLPSTDYDAAPLERELELELSDERGTARAWQLSDADEQIKAIAMERSAQGYAGDIEVIVGIDRDGQVVAARVTNHRETPGLGDDIEARRSDWIDQFEQRSLADPSPEDWAVAKDGGEFDQITGATISARAVVEAVHDALTIFAEHRDELLAPQQIPATDATDE